MSDPSYLDFLSGKRRTWEGCGFAVDPATLPKALFPFQRDITGWGIQRGRASIFSDCGTGKTPMQLAWSQAVHRHTGRDVLIFAPLAVSAQTKREGAKFGIPVTVCREARDLRPGINITNYERLEKFTPDRFGAIVLDESSILKGYDGVTRKALTAFAKPIPYRLACTATPAPNDIAELINHAEFLEIMTGKEIIALFFTQDGNTTHKWRLKGHAREDFWRWLASWSVALRKPSDLGYADEGFILPPLNMRAVTVSSPSGLTTLFPMDEGLSLQEMRASLRESLPARVAAAAEMVNADSKEPWLVYCNLNAESEALARAIPDAVEVTGSDDPDDKERALLAFAEGRTRVLVSKASIAGHGLNFQHCARVAFVGLSYSFEQMYQSIRRCWRFGQERPVDCYIITAEAEGAVVEAVKKKERAASELMDELVGHMAGLSLVRAQRDEAVYAMESTKGDGWTLYLGDCVERMKEIGDSSVGLTVYSPPFPGMYSYTNSMRDMGNAANYPEMLEHYKFLVPELLRVTMLGRSCCVHLTQSVAFKGKDGYIGLKDFRGAVIQIMQDAGWIYYGEVTIDKDPQVKAVRTKDRGLLFKTLATDSAHLHMALADYLLQFRKPGENPTPIRAGISEKYDNPDGWITNEEWIEWAAPVWYRERPGWPGGIRETDVLNVSQARETDDERHLAPLQLGVIERAVKLWSNPRDLVLSPFAGVGSEGFMAIKLNRRFVGIELKASYYKSAIRNLRRAEDERPQLDLLRLPDAGGDP